jgi:hypothetical protein
MAYRVSSDDRAAFSHFGISLPHCASIARPPKSSRCCCQLELHQEAGSSLTNCHADPDAADSREDCGTGDVPVN